MSAESSLETGDSVLIKRISGVSAGDPTQGIGVTYSYATTPSRAIIENVQQEDIMNSGGLYQVGDLSIQLTEKLSEIVSTTGTGGDRVIWRESEYRVVGKRAPAVLVGDTYFYSYVVRKADE
jgi:hypothetical protein